MHDYGKLLESKGFVLGQYSDGNFWILEVTKNEAKKQHILNTFRSVVGLAEDSPQADGIILRCTDQYTDCAFYSDLTSVVLSTGDFMKCVEKI